MKRLLIPVLLMVGACARAGVAAAPTADRPSAYSYLFLVDTSASMSRQKDIATETVYGLVAGGFNDRIQPGEALGIWLFSDQLYPNRFPAQAWDPARKQDLANLAWRFLRDQRPAKKADMSQAVNAINAMARTTGPVVMFLVTNGATPVAGTPFDPEINTIFRNHAANMRDARKPFVVALVAGEGKLVAHAVSPGGGPIHIPPILRPAKPVIAQAPQPEMAAPTPTEEKPKPLSVEEIARILRETARLETSTNAVPPPVSAPKPELQSQPVASPKPAQEVAAVPAPVTNPPKSAIAQPAAPPIASPKEIAVAATPVRDEPLSAPPVSAAPAQKIDAPAQPVIVLPQAESAPAPSPPTTVAPQSKPNVTEKKPAELPPLEQLIPRQTQPPPEGDGKVLDRVSLAPQNVAVVAPQSPSHASRYLMGGIGLLLLTGGLGWFYVRSLRYKTDTTFITRSVDTKDK